MQIPWAIGAGALMGLTALLALSPLFDFRNRFVAALQDTWVFGIVASLTLLFFRLPVIASLAFANSDEAQMTAQAITLLHHPMPWRDFDGTTSGPLNTLILDLPALIGLTPSLHTTRLIGALLLLGSIAFFYLAMRCLWGEVTARISSLLPLSLICAATDGAYVQYASELLSIQLMAIALYILAVIATDPRKEARLAPLVLAGVALGSLPFAKLQSAPLGAFLVLSFAIVIQARYFPLGRTRLWLAFCSGLLLIPIAILSIVLLGGVFADFVRLYVIFPRAYLASNGGAFAGPSFFFASPPFAAFFSIAAGIGVAAISGFPPLVAALFNSRDLQRRVRLSAVFFFLMAAVAVYSIEAPKTPFFHYLLFLMLPVSGLLATFIGGFLRDKPADFPPRLLTVSSCVIAVLCTTPILAGSLLDNPYANGPHGFGAPRARVVSLLRLYI